MQLMASARAALAGRWRVTLLVLVVYLAIPFFIQLALRSQPFVSMLVLLGLSGPLQLGYTHYMLAIARGQRPAFGLLFAGFRDVRRGVSANLRIFLALMLATLSVLLVFVALGALSGQLFVQPPHPPGPALLLWMALCLLVWCGLFCWVWMRLSMSYYLLIDQPGLPARDALRQSRSMMRGNLRKFFLLWLCMQGWYLLALVLTLGIATLWVVPYASVAMALFYEDIRARPDDPAAAAVDADPFAVVGFSD